MEANRYFVDYFDHSSYLYFLGPFSSIIETPITRTRFILQCQQELIKQGEFQPAEKYKGIIDVVRRTIKDNGALGLWRGLIPNFFYTSIQISTFYSIYHKLPRYEVKNTLTYYNGIISNGIFASTLSLLFTLPFDYYRTKISLNFAKQIETNGEGSFFDVLNKTRKKEGVLSIGRGFYPAVFCTTIYRGVFISLYESIFSIYELEKQNQILSLILAYSSVNVANLFAYPFDTVRRRMFITNMMDKKYLNTQNALYEIVKNEGFSSLYRGFSLKLYNSIFSSILLYSYFKLFRGNGNN